jgi:predicted TPR repeat methyltransferase
MPISDYQLAIQHHQAGRLREAESLYRRILEKNPSDANALRMLGILASEVNRNDIAADFLQQALNLLPQNAMLHAELAEVQRRLGKFQPALENATRAVMLQPDLFDGHFNLAVILHEQRNIAAAIEAYKKAISINPKHAAAHYNLANIYREQQQYDLAIAAYQTALEVNPEYLEACGNLGLARQARGREGDLEAAVELFAQVAAKRPGDVVAQVNLGNALREKGELVQAISAYNGALKINPNDAAALNNLGKLMHDAGHLEDAITQYQKAIDAAPMRPEAYQNLGLAYEKLGKSEQAVAMYSAALERGASAPEARFHMAAMTGKGAPKAAPSSHVTAVFNQLAETFDQHLVEKLHYQTPQLLYDAVMASAPSPARFETIFDLGCGTGLCAPRFKPHAGTLIGIDLSVGMLEKARRRNLYDQLVLADLIPALNARPNAANLAIAADVLPYFGDLGPLFTAVHGALQAGGMFAFSVESVAPPTETYILQATRRYAHAEKYLRALAQAHGFTVRSMTAGTLREEAGHPVHGLITVMQRS